MNLRASLIVFDIKQDRAGAAIDGEIVEQIAEIDVDHVADRDHGGEADLALRAHSIRPAAMAPDCEISARSPSCGIRAAKLALSFDRRHQHAEAIWTDQPQAEAARAACSAASASEPRPWPSRR